MSRFRVLHTPVTSAPNDFAIWTAKVPTPPDAPLIKTFCPGWTFPLSRTACNAVMPAMSTEAACSKVTFAGFSAIAESHEDTRTQQKPRLVRQTPRHLV